MQVKAATDWRESMPFEVPVVVADVVPGDPTRCATCGVDSTPRPRTELWAVKHRHPKHHGGYVRFYCSAHAPHPQPASPPALGPARTRTRSAAQPARSSKPATAPALCPDCFVEIPATGVCGMCGRPAG